MSTNIERAAEVIAIAAREIDGADLCAEALAAEGLLVTDEQADWRAIATDLHAALASFMAYDGYGRGGAEDGNQGDWNLADRASFNYIKANTT